MLWIVLLLAAVAVGYWLLIRPHKYWVERGVPQGSPTPFFGENFGLTFRTQSFSDLVQMVYTMFPNNRYSGFYQFFIPTLTLRDPELIKQITVKDFDHFVDHRSFISEESDPLWANNLFALTGKKWRDMRSTLSPAFTSSKMKYMFSLISTSGKQFSEHFRKKQDPVIEIEMKDIFTRFTNDVIANVAFGVECDSLEERKNEFYVMGKDVTDFSGFWKNFKFIGYLFAPKLFQYLGVRFFEQKIEDFFTNLVTSNIQSREKHNIVRPDMINLLMEAKKNGVRQEPQSNSHEQDMGFATVQEAEDGKNGKSIPHQVTDKDIVSQALIFFFAGFDSVSSLMCFMSYELGINPDIQKKLIEEIDETRKSCKGDLTYEALLGMKYLDMVVSESLRKWPNAVAVDRICTKPYTIEPKHPDEQPVHLQEKAVVWIPIFGIHRDPQYYPNPDKFDPERFSDENRDKIQPYTYLPFGSGPRNCIGSRFALLETKILFYYILSNFEIVPIKKTEIPLKISKKSFNLGAHNGFWLGLKKRVA